VRSVGRALEVFAVRVAIAAALLCPGAGLAVETQWRFDGTVASVTSPWSQSIPVGAPVRGVMVLDRGPTYVQTGDPCTDGSATRSFYSVRQTNFFIGGARASGVTSAPPGVDCAPAGLCDVTVQLTGCQVEVFEVDFDASPLASAQLGDVGLMIGLLPSVLPPAFYTSIPDSPWAAEPGGLFGSIDSAQGSIQLDLTSLSRAQVCGDINLDLVVDGADVLLLRGALANPSSALPTGGASRCSVIGGASDCDLVDVAVLRRALAAGLPPGVQQVCAAMTGG